MTVQAMSYRVSDHFALWAEFETDQSTTVMATLRGLNPASPNPFASIPD
jgi:hypothetical protein